MVVEGVSEMVEINSSRSGMTMGWRRFGTESGKVIVSYVMSSFSEGVDAELGVQNPEMVSPIYTSLLGVLM